MPKSNGSVVVNAKVKGAFGEERKARTDKQESVFAKERDRQAKLAAKQAAIRACFNDNTTHIECPVCFVSVKLPAPGDDPAVVLQTHQAEGGCFAALPGRHRFPCVACKTPGHLAPNDKRCTDDGRAAWAGMTPDSRAQLLRTKKDEWRASYWPRQKLKRRSPPMIWEQILPRNATGVRRSNEARAAWTR